MQHRIASPADWLTARRALLEKEEAFARLQAELVAERRALPWVAVEQAYVFDAPGGPVSLGDLFAGRSQLFVKHFMLAPGQAAPCFGCSFEVEHVGPMVELLASHDVSYVAVARAPIDEIETVRRRMGWRFPWVSSHRNTFSYDYGVSFTSEQRAAGTASYNYRAGDPGIDDLPGNSVFYRDETGRIFHTYSSYGGGGEWFLGVNRLLDATPKGGDGCDARQGSAALLRRRWEESAETRRYGLARAATTR